MPPLSDLSPSIDDTVNIDTIHHDLWMLIYGCPELHGSQHTARYVLNYCKLWVSWITLPSSTPAEAGVHKVDSCFRRNGINKGGRNKTGASLNGFPRLNRPCDRLLP